MAARANHEAVKVVFIDTRYVVTDPMSFKSVVQSLTGKDSSVAWLDEGSSVAPGAKRQRERELNNINGGMLKTSSDNGASLGAVVGGDSQLSKGLSFKDLDRMILEQPTVEEWHQLLLQYNLS
ncbi:hypothetical protein Tsubulata_024426 [Turnera subulata]|uniref:VQ domain-containing protein n=1 Tax=Turnera subulata TaxID=218843 RepID=A0A9Q0FHS6_9ROSI|nr:hypothetical protein Tsubulata_024426 [Turnera subulata]